MDVFVLQQFYWTGSRKLVGVFTTYDAAHTAMRINHPSATVLDNHWTYGDHEQWVYSDGLEAPTNRSSIERLPLSGGA